MEGWSFPVSDDTFLEPLGSTRSVFNQRVSCLHINARGWDAGLRRIHSEVRLGQQFFGLGESWPGAFSYHEKNEALKTPTKKVLFWDSLGELFIDLASGVVLCYKEKLWKNHCRLGAPTLLEQKSSVNKTKISLFVVLVCSFCPA